MWKGPRERSFSAPPQPFSCLTSVQLFAQLHYSCIFLQNTSEKHTRKKPAGDLPTFCPPCHGPTKTSKVWVQTNIFSHKEVTWSRDQKYLQFSERLDGHFDLWGWNFSLWLVITIVHFVFREEIQVNQNTNTSRDFVAWNSWKLTSWACYRGCCAKGKKSWRCCLVRKYVRYTKMTPVVYFAQGRVTWSRDQKYLQVSERPDCHFDLWGRKQLSQTSLFCWWLQ